MKVIICGAGQVGYSIAAYLSRENNDVTVIDVHKPLISKISDDLDVSAIVGHAANPDTLNSAGANDADMLIAVTQSDEVNMVACQIAHSLFGVPKKIARVREQSYLKPEWSNLFSRAHMPIDVIISPEVLVAQDIYQRLAVPGTTFVSILSGGLAHLIGIICHEDCPVLHRPIQEIYNLFPDLSFKILAVLRKNKPFVPDEHTDSLERNDEIFFVVDSVHLQRVLAIFGHEEQEAHKILISGGGNIGEGLALLLQKKTSSAQIKIIDNNLQRCAYLSQKFENYIILNGSTLERHILQEASIDKIETMIAVTNDDESNILGSLLAKQYGCKRVITLVNNEAYSPLVGPLGVDSMISPRSIIVANIMQHVRRGRIKGIYNLRDGFAEIIEAEVSESSSIVNKTVNEISVAHQIIVGGIIRDEKFIAPGDDFVIRVSDDVVILAARDQVQSVEKLFSVQVDLF